MPYDAPATTDLSRLRGFVGDFGRLLQATLDQDQILVEGGALLADLVAHDDWLPDAYAQSDPVRYRQYLLHCDSLQRFSVVSFVWGPGQATPIHDHTVWGLVGVLRGAEISQAYQRRGRRLISIGRTTWLRPGQVTAVSPDRVDIHRVANAHANRTSISIHVYGGDIGAIRRSIYDEAGGSRPFTSSYANTSLPNLWGDAPTTSTSETP